MKDMISVPTQTLLDLVWLQACYAWQINLADGGDRRPIKLPGKLMNVLTDRERRAREDAGEEADAPRVALMLDAEELGAVLSACDIVTRSSSGDGPYLEALQRVLRRLRPYARILKGSQ
jgi:hypothetical protein